MKFKIVMTITGLTIMSTGYGMEHVDGKTNSSHLTNRTKAGQPFPEQKALKDLQNLQDQQRRQLSSPFRAISNFSKNTLGMQEQGMLVSGKLSLYDQTLADLRDGTGDYTGLKKSMIPTSTIGTAEYRYPSNAEKILANDPKIYSKPEEHAAQTSRSNTQAEILGTHEFYANNGVKIAINPITGTIKWVDKNGHIIKKLFKNLNGKTTQVEFLSQRTTLGQPHTLTTTYATNNPLGQRTVIESSPMFPTKTTNYNEIGKEISQYNAGNITIDNVTYNFSESGYRQALRKFLSDQVTGKTGGMINSARSLTLPNPTAIVHATNSSNSLRVNDDDEI